MKTQKRTGLMLMAMAGMAMYAIVGCGGSNPDDVKAQSTEEAKPTDNTDATASPDGVGRFAGKEVAAFDAAQAENGKKIFESKCAACHQITDQKVVGPGLKGVTTRRSAAWILNMITNPVEMTQKDPVAKGLLAEHLTQMTNQDINDADALALLNYMRQNDGSK